MIKCKDCGRIMEFAKVGRESHGEEYCYCGGCGGSDFIELTTCPLCGDYVEEGAEYEPYCNDCVEMALDKARRMIRMHLTFEQVQMLGKVTEMMG